MAKNDKNVNLTASYNELNQQGQNGEYDRALKTANKILHVANTEQKAFHCRIVCLIQLGKFQDALKHLGLSPDLSTGLDFERAYALYRLNRTEESEEVLRNIQNPDERIKELLAQVLYRKEQYDDSFSIYKDLIKNTQDDYEEERNTNLTAVMAALQMWDHQDVADLGLEYDTYELCYNKACGLLGQGSYKEALSKLKTAEELCRQMYEDTEDQTEEEIEAELGDIRVQMGYTLQQLGKNDEAMKQYNMVIKSRPTDVALTAVASNNIITLNKDQNVFDSQKRIKALSTDGLQQKLTRLQKHALTLNMCLFYLLQNKNDLCRKSLATLKQGDSESDLPALLQAALLTKEKQHAKAINILKAECDKSDALQLRLAIAQIQLQEGQTYKACDSLQQLGDDSYKLGVVSALVALYLSQEDYDGASEVLINAVEWHKKNKPNSADLPLLMRANANFQLVRGNPEEATKMLEDLRAQNPGDLKTLAQLISAYSKFDPHKAQLLSRELPVPKDLSQVMDVDSLESSANVGARYIKKVTKGEMSPKPASPGSAESDALLHKKKKKKKKVKLPKNVDPDSTPDPERWLPLRERSYYRGKRKKKNAGVGKGTQGAVSAATAAEFDKSGPSQPAAAEKQESTSTPTSPKPGSANAQAASGPRQQKPGGAKPKSKKKKGSKW